MGVAAIILICVWICVGGGVRGFNVSDPVPLFTSAEVEEKTVDLHLISNSELCHHSLDCEDCLELCVYHKALFPISAKKSVCLPVGVEADVSFLIYESIIDVEDSDDHDFQNPSPIWIPGNMKTFTRSVARTPYYPFEIHQNKSEQNETESHEGEEWTTERAAFNGTVNWNKVIFINGYIWLLAIIAGCGIFALVTVSMYRVISKIRAVISMELRMNDIEML